MIRRIADSPTTGNLLWLVVCLLLAVGVWFIATNAGGNFEPRAFPLRPIIFKESDAVALISSSANTARVTVQGAQETVRLLTNSDIEVFAALAHLPPGTHTVPLEVRLPADGSPRLVSRVQPAEITVELESRVSQEAEVKIDISKPPPIGYRHDDPEPDIKKVLLSGAASRVAQVQAARGELDLSTSRNSIEIELRLDPVDAAGNRVLDVNLEPQTVMASVNISRRADVKPVTVRPDTGSIDLREDYSVTGYTVVPETLYISGAPAQLALVGDTLLTEAITLEEIRLENPAEEFVMTVLVPLPAEELAVLGGSNVVTVTIEISQDYDSRQFDNIKVGHFGLVDDFTVSIVPKTVSAIVTGPVVLVEALTAEDIKVNVDLEGKALGVYDLSPTVFINQSDLSADNVSVSPMVLNVEITSPAVAQTATPAAEQ